MVKCSNASYIMFYTAQPSIILYNWDFLCHIKVRIFLYNVKIYELDSSYMKESQ